MNEPDPILEQLKALSGGVRPETEATAASLPAQAADASPASPVFAPAAPVLNTTLNTHDVVQIISTQHSHYGSLFTVGEVKQGRVHGYVLGERGQPEYLTAGTHELHRIGEAKIRSRKPCSNEWIEEHSEPK